MLYHRSTSTITSKDLEFSQAQNSVQSLVLRNYNFPHFERWLQRSRWVFVKDCKVFGGCNLQALGLEIKEALVEWNRGKALICRFLRQDCFSFQRCSFWGTIQLIQLDWPNFLEIASNQELGIRIQQCWRVALVHGSNQTLGFLSCRGPQWRVFLTIRSFNKLNQLQIHTQRATVAAQIRSNDNLLSFFCTLSPRIA